MLLIGASGRVDRDEDFVFYNNPRSADGAVTLTANGASIDTDLLPKRCERVVLVISAGDGDSMADATAVAPPAGKWDRLPLPPCRLHSRERAGLGRALPPQRQLAPARGRTGLVRRARGPGPGLRGQRRLAAVGSADELSDAGFSSSRIAVIRSLDLASARQKVAVAVLSRSARELA